MYFFITLFLDYLSFLPFYLFIPPLLSTLISLFLYPFIFLLFWLFLSPSSYYKFAILSLTLYIFYHIKRLLLSLFLMVFFSRLWFFLFLVSLLYVDEFPCSLELYYYSPSLSLSHFFSFSCDFFIFYFLFFFRLIAQIRSNKRVLEIDCVVAFKISST